MSILHKKVVSIPSREAVERELKRERYKHRYRSTLRRTVYSLLVVAAAAVLTATVFLPVLKIYGSSMEPTLNAGEVVVAVKNSAFTTGDIVGLYVGNKLLVKRIIAGPKQWVNISEDGTVTVDGEVLDEPYLISKAYGDVQNITFPHQVADARYFVMGDDRARSQDSRNMNQVGEIAEEQIVGKIVFRLWPIKRIGSLSGK